LAVEEDIMSMGRHLTRRELLRASAGSLLAAGLWPGALQAADANAGESFHFVAINDLHYLDKRCTPWHEGVVKQIKAQQEKVEFCLLVGDLAEHGKAEQLEPVRTIYKDLGMPLHIVIGNHDWQAEKDRKAYDDLFPKATNYSFEHRGWLFVGIDTSDGPKAQVAVPENTLKWLDGTLPKLDKKKPLVLFTHFPLGPLVPYRPANANEVLERFKEHALQTVFNGHFHASTERKVGAVTLTTNRCCSFSRKNHDFSKEKGYFLCQAKDGKVSRQFVEFKMD
jgi:predicted phosphodiesterase